MKLYSKLALVLIIAMLIFAAGCSGNEKVMFDAVKKGDTAKVESLLDKGVSPDLKLEDGRSILMLAAYLGHSDIAGLLIDKGADVNAKDKDGKTALMYTAETGNIEMARLLLEKSADLNAVDNTGKTALQIAQENYQSAMVEFLSNWGKPPTSADTSTPAVTETTASKETPKSMPEIKTITPNKGFNNGSVLVSIEGSNFVDGLQVKLTGATGDISGINIKVETAAKVSCFFDLNNKTAGQYKIVLTNPDGQVASFKDVFMVEAFVPAPANRILKPLFFDFNSWNIREDQKKILNDNLTLLRENPQLHVILGGHADERGSREYNLELTAKRAQAVKDYFVTNGIAADQIFIYAFGKDHPAKLGHDEAAWQYNRRVDSLDWETVLTKEQVIDETIK
jgi:outer membrane protein OmpA-like peptidoglycan-associated protein